MRSQAWEAGEPFAEDSVFHIWAREEWEDSRSQLGHQDWSSISIRWKRGKRIMFKIFFFFFFFFCFLGVWLWVGWLVKN